MRSSAKNCATHSDPKAATLATSTARVRLKRLHPAASAHAAVIRTASVERERPAKERMQKGTISAAIERRPDLPHTQRRLSSKEGMVPTAVAAALAQPAGRRATPTRTPSRLSPTAVDMAETPA